MKHVFILGKELFRSYNPTVCSIINSLAQKSSDPNITYHVSCLANKQRFMPSNVNNTSFFGIHVPKLGYFSYVLYDMLSLCKIFKYIKKHSLSNCTILLFSSRIGIFLPLFEYKIKQYGISLLAYCEQNIQKSIWTLFTNNFMSWGQYYCIKYCDLLLSTSNTLTSCLNSKHPTSSIITLSCDLSTFDEEFYYFLKQFDSNIYDYYLIIGEFTYLSCIYNVLTLFNKCTSPKKLIVLSKKDSRAYKSATFVSDFHTDKRIIVLNISRFEHLILHLVKYCHAFIHYNFHSIKKDFLEYTLNSINLVMDSPFNRNARLPNVFYFDEDNFNNVLEQVDSISIPRNSPELNLNNTKALQLVKTIENLF